MVQYPISFISESNAQSKDKSWTLKTEEGLQTEMTAPPEFGGDKDKPSPEDLFTASLTSCLIATFKATAQRKGLKYEQVEVKGNVELERGEKEGRPFMKEGKFEVKVKDVSDKELAEAVAEITDRNCFIKNSVQTDVKTDFRFN